MLIDDVHQMIDIDNVDNVDKVELSTIIKIHKYCVHQTSWSYHV